MRLKIRKAQISDFDFVYSFICDLAETQFNRKSFQKIFKKNLLKKNIFYLVAENENKVIGFISIYIQPQLHHCVKVAEIMELFVNEKFRKRKIGAQLIKRAETIAKKNNCVLIESASNMRRADTHRFYEREKFSKTHFKFTKKISGHRT